MYNKITVMGRIATVPELKTSQNGIPYARFRVAVNRRFHNKDNEQVDFFNVTAWRNNAEFISKYFSKGSMIMLDGEMQTQQYEDRNGNPATWYEIVVDRACFTGEAKKENNNANGGYNRNNGYNGGGSRRSYSNRQNGYGNSSYNNGQQTFNEPPVADDYPF